MAGAISGTFLGIEAIPQNLAQQLTDKGSWGFDDLRQLAEKSYHIKCAG